MPRRTLRFIRKDDEREYQVMLREEDGQLHTSLDRLEFLVVRDGDGRVRVTSNRTVTAWATSSGASRWVYVDGNVYEFAEAGPEERTRGRSHHGSLSAPMPATVRRVLVSVDDPVRPGDTLLILEAMKMELPIRATDTGIVSAVNCREGELVQPGVPLVEIEASPTGP
jgi:3-methylcrotonyl-CoA carboxylase alpha subunit